MVRRRTGTAEDRFSSLAVRIRLNVRAHVQVDLPLQVNRDTGQRQYTRFQRVLFVCPFNRMTRTLLVVQAHCQKAYTNRVEVDFMVLFCHFLSTCTSYGYVTIDIAVITAHPGIHRSHLLPALQAIPIVVENFRRHMQANFHVQLSGSHTRRNLTPNLESKIIHWPTSDPVELFSRPSRDILS